MPRGYSLPGEKYRSANSKLAQLLLQDRINNGSTAGGLGHVLQRGLAGYMIGADESDRNAANQALMRGLTAEPWADPDIPRRQPQIDEDGAVTPATLPALTKPPAPSGGIPGGLAALQQQPDNPYASRLAARLATSDYDRRTRIADAKDLYKFQQEAQGPKLTTAQRNWQAAQDDPGFKEFLEASGAGNTPSAVQEYEYLKNLSPEQQQLWFLNKRSAQTINLGGTQATVDPRDPTQNIAEREVTLKPGETPEVRGEQAAASAEGAVIGKATGEAKDQLAAAEAAFPRLQAAVTKLKDLGKTATYTGAGQLADIAKRQAGADPGLGAVNRAKYIAHVKNNVLPLLRQTFGAAFTAAEGESLLATLGDPDMHPSEKDAVLDAFIADKAADLNTQRRRVGEQPQASPPIAEDAEGNRVMFDGQKWVPMQ